MVDEDRMTGGQYPGKASGQEAPSRRSLLRGAGIGAAGLAAGAIGGIAAGHAAAERLPSTRPAAEHSYGDDSAEPVVVYVRDARTGELDVFRGTSQIRFRDLDLAARLIRASR